MPEHLIDQLVADSEDLAREWQEPSLDGWLQNGRILPAIARKHLDERPTGHWSKPAPRRTHCLALTSR